MADCPAGGEDDDGNEGEGGDGNEEEAVVSSAMVDDMPAAEA